MLALKHKLFELESGSGPFWTQGAILQAYEGVRLAAEDFADEIGAENVVSIVEHLLPRFSVFVWYRQERGAKAKPAPADEFFEAPPDYQPAMSSKSIGA